MSTLIITQALKCIFCILRLKIGPETLPEVIAHMLQLSNSAVVEIAIANLPLQEILMKYVTFDPSLFIYLFIFF